MIRLLKPKIIGATAASEANKSDDWHDRITKYIPVEIAGAYPLLDNLILDYVKDSKPLQGVVGGLFWSWLLFAVVLIINAGFVRRAYRRRYLGPDRRKLELLHIAFGTIAFAIWTYAIKSAVWEAVYDTRLALVLATLFVLTAGLYVPSISQQDAGGSGILPPARPSSTPEL